MQTALAIVDMLNDFVDGALANHAAKSIIGPIAVLTERARTRGDWIVCYVNDAHLLTDVELRVFPPPRHGSDSRRRGDRRTAPRP